METSSPQEEDMEAGRPQEKNIEVNDEVAHGIDFDLEDNVQPPVAHEKVNYDQGFEGKTLGSLQNMRFKTDKEAYECYNDYARKVGFGIRKYSCHKAANGNVTSRTICCSNEGFKRNRLDVKVKRYRGTTRTGCNAHIYIRLEDDGMYTIARHVVDHNHECTPKKIHMFGSLRHISIAQTFEGDLADSVGIRPKVAYDFVSAKAGRPENLEFLSVDYKKYLQLKRMKSMMQGDAGDILQYLEYKLVEDPGFIYKIQLDEDDKISNIFWADLKMVIDYHAFGDVVCFDTTFRTNNYYRPFAPFLGVNHHKQIVVFGAALIYDVTIPSFQFVFESFLSAMSGKTPTTILTDQDKAMAHAISVVMPNTYHRISIWHMHQNSMKHLNHVYTKNKSFKEDFNKCIYEYEEEVDFLDAWERMLEKYNLWENTWLKKLFEEREKWALVYGMDTFCAEINSTQRSESMNSVIRKYIHRNHNLLEFFSHWDRLVKDRQKAEAEADFKMTQSTPNLMMNVPVLVDARNMYTAEIFKLFQDEYEKGMSCIIMIECTEGTNTTYKVHSTKQKRDYIVTFDSVVHTVECCCKKFEFNGILCGHALRVLYHANLQKIPNEYILKRWRKDAKQHTVNISEDKMTTPTRYKELMRTSVKLSTTAAISQEAFELAMDGMNDIMEKLKEKCTAASQCQRPNEMDVEPRREFDFLDMEDDGKIPTPCTNSNATSSIPTQLTGVKGKEKGLKGEREKSAIEEARANINKSTNAEATMDNTCPPSSDLIYQASLVLEMQPEMIECRGSTAAYNFRSDGFIPANISGKNSMATLNCVQFNGFLGKGGLRCDGLDKFVIPIFESSFLDNFLVKCIYTTFLDINVR